MVSRKSAHGVFWGCKAFPKCRGTRNVDGESKPRCAVRYTDEDGETHDLSPSQRMADRDRRRW
jgi:ssDNA-binding Zn-finger/Zn-ribbon topoisomerase 1